MIKKNRYSGKKFEKLNKIFDQVNFNIGVKWSTYERNY